MTDKLLYCSFCGKSDREVLQLIAGPVSFICDECVDLCVEVIEQARAKDAYAKRRAQARKDAEQAMWAREIYEMGLTGAPK